jgi:hypothetical protein
MTRAQTFPVSPKIEQLRATMLGFNDQGEQNFVAGNRSCVMA